MTLLEHAIKNGGERCMCGEPLAFEDGAGDVIVCHCLRCERKSAHDGEVIYVRGHGASLTAAYEDWNEKQSHF